MPQHAPQSQSGPAPTRTTSRLVPPASETVVPGSAAPGGRAVPGCFAGATHWRKAVPGAEPQGATLRRWIADLFPACSARDDLTTIVAEYFANAVRHSESGRPGGLVIIDLSWQAPLLRVAVVDGGGPNTPRTLDQPYLDVCDLDGFDERGRGRLVVEQLAQRTGVVGDEACRVCWAELLWLDDPPASEPVSEQSLTNGVSERERDLSRRFTDATCWFGRTTWNWWGIWWGQPQDPGSGVLISAPSADDLAVTLTRLRLGRGRGPTAP
jgi:anti-sigma regulatory factor (Ser/Thr protein kinase)